MSAPPFAVNSRVVADGVAVLTLRGELDRDTVESLRAEITALQSQGKHRLVCDLTDLTFCDSSGLGLFVDTHHGTSGHGGGLRLTGASAHLRTVFGLLALDRLLEFRDTTEDALTELR